MGNTIAPFAACIVELVMRLGSTIGLCAVAGYLGVCLASPLAWLGACSLLVPVYYHMVTIQSHAHAVSYTHLDVYKRQQKRLPTVLVTRYWFVRLMYLAARVCRSRCV